MTFGFTRDTNNGLLGESLVFPTHPPRPNPYKHVLAFMLHELLQVSYIAAVWITLESFHLI